MNIYKKLISNSLIFAVGNLGSKLIVFLLVPLYTYYLTTSEFGLVDLMITATGLLIPAFSLSIFDSVLRFVMDKNYDKQAILINSFVVTFLGVAILIMLYPVLLILFPFDQYISYFYLLLIAQAISTILNQFIRANGKVKVFAASGIINALLLLILNVTFLVIFHKGITGYLLSLIFSYLGSSLFSFFVGKVFLEINLKKINFQLMKEMLQYSIPLIPNSLMWWIMSLSDRYVITFFLGLSANGLYALANKIPNILSIVSSIFFQAWQLSAIEESKSKEKSRFYTNVFNAFSITMLLSTSLILAHLKFIIELFVADNYYVAWKYVPFLLLGVVFSSFSGFLGTNYIAAKKTSGVFKTSVIGALINILANIILIPKIGINGAAVGTMLSFVAIWLLRIKDTKEFVTIKLNIIRLSLSLLFIFFQIGLLYNNLKFGYLFQILILVIIIIINYKDIKLLLIRVIEFRVKKTQ
ncbi:lipopolysaccharide biosynthesis protein [Bacillus sp. UNC438CL73TsuS30]|uniref:lipopolysaccharide biosynthesis protein n=1 Tax=Bacillus sp. UNC438CL73TsuS30 TaxID=1340434 RepID=UPI00047E9EAF|nr:oligosaccharide flippase family protein [Bacillus sp. UNC438CL73TsuS30]